MPQDAPEKQSLQEGEALLAAFQAGTLSREDFFSRVIALYEPHIRNFLRAHLSEPDQAEDLLQEVYLALHRKLETFRGASSLKTWLFRVARNHLINLETRRPPAASANLETLDPRAPGPSPRTENINKEFKNLVQFGLFSLPRDEREILCMRYSLQMTLEEIAGLTGLSPQVVHYRLQKAVRTLFTFVEKMEK
jgi:RNA polymerase sigma-70 factor (ECF subfamily)